MIVAMIATMIVTMMSRYVTSRSKQSNETHTTSNYSIRKVPITSNTKLVNQMDEKVIFLPPFSVPK